MPEVTPRPKMGRKPRQREVTARRKAEYRVWARQELGRRPWCALCGRRANQLHHRRMLSQGGALISTANTLPVCTACHVPRIHDQPARARRCGWLVYQGDPEWDDLGERAAREAAS